jgi:parallel beta-helix repeat protein
MVDLKSVTFAQMDHDNIVIESDEDFAVQGWPGNGTVSNPYMIEELRIEFDSPCVNISNTQAYFVISNCIFTREVNGGSYGVLFTNVSRGVVEKCVIYSKSRGVMLIDSTDCVLRELTIYDSSNYGIYLHHSTNCHISSNIIFENGLDGITFHDSDSGIIYNNTIYGNTKNGIFLSYSAYTLLSDNLCYQNDEDGVQLNLAWFTNLTGNAIHDNALYGINIRNSDFCNFINNRIYHNQIGIRIDSAGSDNLVFANRIHWNDEHNAFDNGSANDWDDGLATGNSWNDFNGNGDYLILGMAGSEDRYPLPLFFPERPSDIVFEQESSKMYIEWQLNAIYPGVYELYWNQKLHDQKDWDGSPIIINITLLGVGIHNFTLRLFDSTNHFMTDTVFVTVIETAPPAITEVKDLEYMEGIAGNAIIWKIYDANPSSYIILLNDTRIRAGGWDGSDITLPVDGLAPGVYNFTLIVEDVSGNVAIDVVLVTVTPTSTVTGQQESPSLWFSPVLGGILVLSGALVIMVTMLIMSSRRIRLNNKTE